MKPLSTDIVAALRAEGDLKEALRALVSDARAACDRNRRLVLAHPDLAERLTLPPCGFSRPDVWTGYIAPELIDINRHGDGIRNDSPCRAQLVALVAEAERRTRLETAA